MTGSPQDFDPNQPENSDRSTDPLNAPNPSPVDPPELSVHLDPNATNSQGEAQMFQALNWLQNQGPQPDGPPWQIPMPQFPNAPVLPVSISAEPHRYTRIKGLGEGGFGETYLVKNAKGKYFVEKTLLAKYHNRQRYPEIWSNFETEALDVARCTAHPNIVDIEEVIRSSAQQPPALILEYIEGIHLGRCALIPALDHILQLASALEFCHSFSKPLIHRDIKPNNVLIRNSDNQAILIDFGISRRIEPGATNAHTAMHSQGYAPLEQINGEPQGTFTDVYGLAATLFYCLTGEDPIGATQRLNAVSQNNRDPLLTQIETAQTSEGQPIPHVIQQFLREGLALQPQDRIQTMAQFKARLGHGRATLPTIDYRKADYEVAPPNSEPISPDSDATKTRGDTGATATQPPNRSWLWLVAAFGLALTVPLGLTFILLGRIPVPLPPTGGGGSPLPPPPEVPTGGGIAQDPEDGIDLPVIPVSPAPSPIVTPVPVVAPVVTPGPLVTHDLTDQGFQIQAPNNWIAQVEQTGFFQDTVFSAVIPGSNASFPAKVAVDAFPLDQPWSIEQAQQDFNLPVAVQSEQALTFQGQPAYEWVYTSTDSGISIQRRLIATASSTTEYWLTYEATQDEYDRFAEPAAQVMQSFQLQE